MARVAALHRIPTFPQTPQRTPRPHPALAHTRPIRSPVPEKTSPSRAIHSSALTYPTPHTTHLVPTPAPFLPTNPPQSLSFATPIEGYAHSCYPRPREEPTLRPGNPTPNWVAPQASVGASLVGALRQRRHGQLAPSCPLSSSDTRRDILTRIARPSITDLRVTTGAPS